MLRMIPFITALAGSVAASSVRHFVVSGQQNCTTFTQPIKASGLNTHYTITSPGNNQQLAATTIREWTSGSTYIQDHINGTREISGTYDIYVKYCEPAGAKGNTKAVQQFTHGLVGDHNYWDVVLGKDASLSQVAATLKAGYATLTYDRLAVANSASGYPDGINVVQGALQTDIALQLGKGLKDGSLGLGSHSKVIKVGHSFGSLITVAATGVAPDLYDGIVLTGFTANATVNRLFAIGFYGQIASTVTKRFKGLPNAYLLPPSQTTDQFGFFHYPNYTQASIDKFTANKGTYTIGELLSIENPWFSTSANYTKPVFVVTGENDSDFCEGDCFSTSLPAGKSQLDTVSTLFPAAKAFGTYVVPDTGHGITFHETAPASYAATFKWLEQNGL